MSKQSFLFLVIACIGLGLLASCTPVCAPEALVAPLALDPTGWEFVPSLMPMLTWEYPDTSCKPEGFRIEIYKAPYYTLFMDGGASGGDSTTWFPATNLDPHSVYKWRVIPMVGTTLGPASNAPRFTTGPRCADDDLSAPMIIDPEDGQVMTDPNYIVKLQYPDDCLPYGLMVQLSMDSTFTGTPPEPSEVPALAFMLDLTEDCTTYYLRAWANDEDSIGPISDITSIWTNFNGLCPDPSATAAISGTVWNDVCILPATGPLPSPLPEGCIPNGSGGAWADAWQSPDESGIPNVEVMLGKGFCPSCGLGSVLTDANGNYFFPELSAGHYCVCINAEGNDTIIKPGMWTLVMSGHEGWTYRHIFLPDAANFLGQDFGWYHYQTYMPFEESTIQAPVKCGSINNQQDCDGYPWCIWYQDQFERNPSCHNR